MDLFITKAITTAAPYVSPCLQDLGASLKQASPGGSSYDHADSSSSGSAGLSEAVSQLLAAHPQLAAAVATAAAAEKTTGGRHHHAKQQHDHGLEEQEDTEDTDTYAHPGEPSFKQRQKNRHYDDGDGAGAGAGGYAAPHFGRPGSWLLDATEVEELYRGVALVATGVITSVTGATNGQYNTGRLQYVPVMWSSSEPLTETSQIEAALAAARADRVPLVTGGQLQLAFEREGGK